MRTRHQDIPSFDALMIPTLEVMQALGGSGTIQEINKGVADWIAVPDSVLEKMHLNTSVTEIDYRLAWSRTYLKKVNLITNSSRGVWSLSDDQLDIRSISPQSIVATVRSQRQRVSTTDPALALEIESTENPLEVELGWEQQLPLC